MNKQRMRVMTVTQTRQQSTGALALIVLAVIAFIAAVVSASMMTPQPQPCAATFKAARQTGAKCVKTELGQFDLVGDK